MNHNIKSYITTGLLMVLCTTLQAQHELSFKLFGGLHMIQSTLSHNGANSSGNGGGAGIGYNLNLSPNWSIGTGIDVALYRSSMKWNQLTNSYTAFDKVENTPFTFTAGATNFNENLSAMLLEIPLTLRYSLPVGRGDNSLRFTGGIKCGWPVEGKYTASADQLRTTGKYHDENQEYMDIPGIFTSEAMGEHAGTFTVNMAMMATVEIAYRWMIGDGNGLSLGLYLNHGLNDIQSKNDTPPIAFDENAYKPYASNSSLHSNIASSIRPVAFGIKIQFDLEL